MPKRTSLRRAQGISSALCLMGLAIVAYLHAWWPGIMLAIGLPLALRQFLLGRNYDMWVSLVIFCGVFIISQFDISWDLILPVLFAVGGIYILFREYFESKTESESEREEDINCEIEEDQHK